VGTSSRTRQPAVTRQRICAAAKELFLTRGYDQTTISQIAKSAGVAQQTVYFVYGSKAAVLAAVLDVEIVGDTGVLPLLERPQVRRLARVSEPSQLLQQIVRVATDITERLAPLYEIVRGGTTDAAIGELLDRHEAQRWQSLHHMTTMLDGELAAGLTIDDATDSLYSLLSHEVFWLLVHRRGWPATRWRQHVAAAAERELLPEPLTPARRRR